MCSIYMYTYLNWLKKEKKHERSDPQNFADHQEFILAAGVDLKLICT